jgi:hypothetical protein
MTMTTETFKKAAMVGFLALCVVFGLATPQTNTILGIILGIYFLPTIVAALRHHQQVLAIFLLNLLLGWTLLGWVAALVWCVIRENQNRRLEDYR